MRRFFVDKIENMRDIGGYYISNNKTVKSGRIIGTNLITQLEEKDIKKIKDMGFSTVIDLRSDEEIKRKKGILDYVASGIYLENMLNNYAKEMNNENILKIITPKKETMYKLLNNIKNQYGSVEEYLQDCNITNKIN